MQTGWVVRITGTVAQIHRLDVDKSGRHPKYMVRIQLNAEAVDDAGFGLELDAPVVLQGKETEIVQQLGRNLQTGERLIIRSSGTEKHPRLLIMDGLQFVA